MTKKCLGCGIELQCDNPNKLGYIDKKHYNNVSYCLRCFRINHYGDYQKVDIPNKEFINILLNINKTNDLVLYVVDLFNIEQDINKIKKYLNNPIILVLSKRDILPSDIKDEKILNYFNNSFLDKIIISSKKNYGMDNLLDKIKKFQTSNNVYVIGKTNSGKSTLINKIIYNYSDYEFNITTSVLPSTTLDMINVKINDNLTLIDTPGLLDYNGIENYVDGNLLKNILPNNTIKPITYQVKEGHTFVIDGLLELEYFGEENSLTFYFSNNLELKRIKPDSLNKGKIININGNEDIVITGLGFIKVKKEGKILIRSIGDVSIYKRKALI